MHQTITTTTVTKEVTTAGGLTHHHYHHNPLKQGHVMHHHPVGTFTFRPIQGKFLHDKDLIGKMDPYCKIKIGWHSGKSSVAKSQGTHPTWSDAIVLTRKHGEQFARLKVKDRDRLRVDDRLGQVKINLDDVAARGKVAQWFTLHKGDKVTGEILVDIEYHPNLV